MQRSALASAFLTLVEANIRENIVEEAFRYRALTELSALPTDDLVSLAARTAQARRAEVRVAEELRSFGGEAPDVASAGYWA